MIDAAAPTYVELHAHSYYSLLDATCAPAALVERAAALGMPALALTDHDAVYGAVEFVTACRAAGIRPILGAELTLHDHSHLTLLAENDAGWQNLCRLITLARHNAPKGAAVLPKGALTGRTEGLIALSGCRHGPLAAALDRAAVDMQAVDDAPQPVTAPADAVAIGRHLQTLFGGDNFWIELQNHHLPDDGWRNAALAAVARAIGAGLVATNNVHYATPERRRLQDVLVCTRHLTSLDAADALLRPNGECYLKPAAAMARLFADYPAAVANTARIADRCRFELRFGLQALPPFPTPDGMAAAAYLRRLCTTAIADRYANAAVATQQADHELTIIERAGLSNYFLIVWDIVRFARENGIACQGRGSAANSLVAYLLHISPIDPLAHNLVFERFLSAERQAVPDIDIDFCARRREEVIQYVYRRYGADHVAMACTFSTFRTRQAIRDACRALGLTAEHAAYALDQLQEMETADRNQLPVDQHPARPSNHLLLDIVQQLRGIPRHLGLHNGGMVIMGAPLADRLPTEPATMADRTVTQWDKDGLESAGLVKIDILGLRMLSAVADTVEIVAGTTGRRIDLTRLTPDDPAVFDMIGAADTMGVFQVESRAQAQVLPRLRPRTFNDLIVSISLIRPGPVQGNMVHPYLRRRAGEEPVTYAHPSLEPALAETLGVILFQEQVLKVARDVAGFTPGQGEQLRRALGSKYAAERIAAFHADFVRGAVDRGVPADTANAIFDSLRAFGGYSFAKSHAAAFAVLVYRSAWLRRHHMPAFFCALFNNQPMGFWNPSVLTGDARRHGIRVLPVDVARSDAVCVLEADRKGAHHIRLGFNYVKGFGEVAIERLLAARDRRSFADLGDLCRRTRLPRRLVEQLIAAGAADAWGGRRDLLWALGRLRYQEAVLPLAYADDADLPPLQAAEAQAFELSATGIATGDHVMAHLRPQLAPQILSSRALEAVPAGSHVDVAGLLVVHQAPYTAKGFRFLTLEDEFGLMNIVVRPNRYPRFRATLQRSALLHVRGTVERQGAVVNVVATAIRLLVGS